MDPEEEVEEKAINELEDQIFILRMRQCEVKRSQEEFDSCEKQIELLHKDLEVLVIRKNERMIMPPLLPDYMTVTGGDERKDRVFNVEKQGLNEQEKEDAFESKKSEADGGGNVKLDLSEDIDDSSIGSGAFNDPDLGIYTNIEGLGEEMREFLQESEGKMQKAEADAGDGKWNLSEDIGDSRIGSGVLNDPDLGIYTNIEGLGEEMHELMQENSQGEMQKACRFIKWIQDCVDSDQELEALQSIKFRAVDLGTKLCHMLVDFVFSMRKTEKLAQKFQSLISCFEDQDSLVIRRFTMLLKMTKVNKYLRGYFVKVEGPELKEDEIDEIINHFVEEIMHLRYILEHEDLPESGFLKGEVILGLEAGIKQCEGKLEEIEMEGVGFVHVDFWGSQMANSQSEEVKSKIDQLWKIFWLSEDVNH